MNTTTIFQEDFRKISNELLQTGENALWAGNIAEFANPGKNEYTFGYAILTPHRLIRILFRSDLQKKSVFRYIFEVFIAIASWLFLAGLLFEKKPKRPTVDVKHIIKGSTYHKCVVAPSDIPLSLDEITTREIDEFFLRDLSSVTRRELMIKKTLNPFSELEVTFKYEQILSIVFYNQENADTVYNIIMKEILSQPTFENHQNN